MRYAAPDPYAGAVGKLLPSEDMRMHALTVDGPLDGPAGLLPELLHVRHMLWRVPDGLGIVPYYRRERPDRVTLAEKLPAPPQATTLADAYARMVE